MTDLEGTHDDAGYTIHYNRFRGILDGVSDVNTDDLRDVRENVYTERDESGVVDSNGVQFGALAKQIDENETVQRIRLRFIVPVEHVTGIDIDADNKWYLRETYDNGEKLRDVLKDMLVERGWIDSDQELNLSPAQSETGSVNVGFTTTIYVPFEKMYSEFTPVQVVGVDVTDYTILQHDSESVYDAINTYTWYQQNPNMLGDIVIPNTFDEDYDDSPANMSIRDMVDPYSYSFEMASDIDSIEYDGFETYLTNSDGEPEALVEGDRENIAGLMWFLLSNDVFGKQKD